MNKLVLIYTRVKILGCKISPSECYEGQKHEPHCPCSATDDKHRSKIGLSSRAGTISNKLQQQRRRQQQFYTII